MHFFVQCYFIALNKHFIMQCINIFLIAPSCGLKRQAKSFPPLTKIMPSKF